MQQIPAFRVKAAVGPAVRKQAQAFGMQPKDFGVRFTGKGAFTGYRLSYGRLTGFINYPAIKDAALMSRIEADYMAAYSLHELGHVFWTDNVRRNDAPHIAQVQGNKALHKIWNGLEDPRIEQCQINYGIGGARKGFRMLLVKLLAGMDTKKFNPANINDAPFAFALMGRAMLGNGTSYTSGLLARIPEPKRSLYAAALAAMVAAPLDREAGTKATMEAAIAFCEGWDALPKDSKPETNPKPEGEDGEEGDDEGGMRGNNAGLDYEDDGEEPEDSDDSDDEFEDSDEDTGTDESDDGSDDSFDFGDDEEKEPEPDTEGADIEDDEGAGNNSGGQLADDDEPLEDVAQHGDGGEGFSDDESEADASKMTEPDPSIDDMVARVNARDDGEHLAPAERGHYSDVSKWDWGKDVSKRAIKIVSDIKMGALKAQLVRMFRAPERNGWDGGVSSGRFDRKMQSRAMAGSENCFKKRWETTGVDTAVTVLVDLSGSMQGTAVTMAAKVAYAIADAAESAKASVLVVGFRSGNAGYICNSGNDISGNSVNQNDAGARAFMPVFKKHGVPLARVADNFARMSKMATGGTPDYSALKTACEDIAIRPEARRMVLVLTDGCGQQDAINKMCQFAESKLGVDVVGIGIGFDDSVWFKSVYPVGEVAPVLESLVGVTLKNINKVLDRRLEGRRVM